MKPEKNQPKQSKEEIKAAYAKLTEQIQSLCTHRRRDFVFEGGRNVTKCLDCGKNLKKPETDIVTHGKPEDA